MHPLGSERSTSGRPDDFPATDLPRQILDRLLEGCQVVDFEWRYCYLNETATTHARRARVELLGKTMMEAYPGIEDTPMFIALRRAMVLRRPTRIENEFRYPDGQVAWFDLRFVPVADGVLILSLDISEQKVAEEALRRSEQKYRELFDHAQVGMFRLSGDGCRLLDANLKLSQILQAPADALIAAGKGIHWADPARFAEFLATLHENRTVEYAELDVETVAGERRFCLVSGALLPNGSGIEGTIRDMTDHVRESQQQLKLLTAIDQSAEAVVVTDPGGAITYVNPAFERITGYQVDEVLGRNPRFLKSGYQDDTFYADFWHALSTGGLWRGRMVNRRKDGTLYTQDSTFSRVVDRSGTVIGFVAVNRDVTSELELEAQLAHAQRMETIGRLAGGIAHDFNNLLAVIIGSSELALGALEADHPQRADIEEIHSAGERASRLTRQLLAFGRRRPIQAEQLDLCELVDSMEPMIRRLLQSDVLLTCQVEPSTARIIADPSQLEQVVMNLAVNARDAMSSGGRLTIHVAEAELDESSLGAHPFARPGRYVRLTMSDTGIGMDEATRARAFEPFYTTKPPGEGTGLGLAMVYAIMKQCDGYVWLYSEPGHGTTFKLYFPLVEALPAAAVAPVAASRDEADGELILLVEDEPAVLAVTRRVLIDAGYRVVAVGSVAEARTMIERQGDQIDLVLSDVVMPEGGGITLATELREAGRTVPVLLMSGYADESVLERSDELDLPAILGKPFSAADLRRRVREAINDRR
jgi:PAS domain S-box-containing protein